MDVMMQAYMEETEDMLQRAEECIIRLEVEYSSVDVNELFRMAHTIKGSSYMVGYEDIGSLMHKIEDMLDCARNGSILFDQSIVTLCFKGLDTVKKILQYKTEPVSQEIMQDLLDAASRISESVEVFIKVNKKEEVTLVIQPEMGIISSRLNRESKGRNKYYITFFIEEDAPMLSPVLMIILNSVEAMGTLVYSSVTDQYFSGQFSDDEIRTFDIILCTDVDEAELYSYFALFYVEKINIVDLSRNTVEGNDYCFNDIADTPYVVILRALMKLYPILFSDLEMKIEERFIIESLYYEATSAFSKLGNKKKVSIFIKDFNELYNLVLTIYDGQSGIEEKIRVNSQNQMVKLIGRIYNDVKGKYIFSIFKSGNDDFIHSLTNFIGMVNKSSFLIILIDISKLDILHENEIKDLIEIKKHLEDQGIEVSILANGPGARRIINIFDSIQPLEYFKVFGSELDAILGMFQSEDSFRRISEKIKGVEHE